MGTTPASFPISTATFRSDTYLFDPLYASDTISQSAKIAGSLGVLKRGTVLCGPTTGPITNATLLTTTVTGASARVILAQDIDTTGGAVVGLVYTQGKFLDTAMTFTSQGAALDCAQLWDYGVYVLTVQQRSGLLVPMTGLPATGGPLPQAMSPKDAAQATKDQVEVIKAAINAYRPEGVVVVAAKPPAGDPAWAIAAFGERKPTPLEQAEEKAAEQADELATKQMQELDKLRAEQSKQLGELAQKQEKEREALSKQAATAIAHAQEHNSPPPAQQPPPPKK